MLSAKWDGAQDAVERLRSVATLSATHNQVDAFLGEARFIRDAVRLRAPVRTGFLRSQVSYGPMRGPKFFAFVNVFSRAHYARMVEYGTVHMKARPFFRPVAFKYKRQLPALTAKKLGVIVRRLARRRKQAG